VEAYERSTARAPTPGATGVAPANGSRPLDDAGDAAGTASADESSGGLGEP
jgi:hypothetical protein